jgi:hypothetical protein
MHHTHNKSEMQAQLNLVTQLMNNFSSGLYNKQLPQETTEVKKLCEKT